jgi:hypothetical protein
MLLPQRKGKSTADPWNSSVQKILIQHISKRSEKQILCSWWYDFNFQLTFFFGHHSSHSSQFTVKSAKNCELLNCETSLITLIPEVCGSDFFWSISKLCSCSLDDSNSLNLSCTRVADPIIAHLRICCKIFSHGKNISCWNLVCSTYPMYGHKTQFSECANLISMWNFLWATTDWCNFCSPRLPYR